MLGIVLFCIGIMYTPGPVNILSLNNGMQRRFTHHAPFCLGVASATSFAFILIGYTGSALINDRIMPFIAAAGVCFIIYLAYKIIASEISTAQDNGNTSPLKFKGGFFMQLLNPKAFLAFVSVAAVQFPAAGINGAKIAIWSMGLGILAFGAPFTYAVFGSTITQRIENTSHLKHLNFIMGILLIVVAAEMAYQHVYPAFQ